MSCQSCGRSLAANLRFCDACGADVKGEPAGVAAPFSQQLKSEVKARSLDAWQGVKLFAKSPVAGLPESFALFDDQRAIQVGIVFAIVYEVALLLGALIVKSKAAALLGGMVPIGALIGEMSAAQLFKVLFLGLVRSQVWSGRARLPAQFSTAKGDSPATCIRQAPCYFQQGLWCYWFRF